ncbi:type VI secretion system-associated protein TagF [Rhizobium halophytocola]|uniref:Type VI secretion system protein ImpM n=1 Tax=Rhizobium halophytocola TaxID=735519 RepID=A0ABS4E682_9HYPH|nr:type VI secretion system-associated protein TagF [Rhizobium halophytocola]MBP1853455.1 type VI secretion system protein ImpM [Rhizobium halophytocola]
MKATKQISGAEADKLGFFGKLPSRGDFISDALERDLIEVVDGWLQDGMQAAASHFGPRWSQVFTRSPPWRFIVEKRVWGPCTYAGVIIPSRDRVGRDYPLLMIAKLHGFDDHPRTLYGDLPWFTAVEGLAESSRARDFDLDHFIEQVRRLRLPRPADDERAGEATGQEPTSLIWCIEPDTGRPRGIRVKGSLGANDFLRLFQDAEGEKEKQAADDLGAAARDGPAAKPARDARAGGPTRPLRDPPDTSAPPQAPARPKPPAALRFSQASHPGTQKTTNADCVFASEACGVFAVIDGIGDGAKAVEAAHLIAGTLGGVAPAENADQVLRDIRGKLGTANSLLLPRTGAEENDRQPAASIVVVSLKDGEFQLLWAGDARAYLIEHGTMRPLTRDHVGVGIRPIRQRGVGLEAQFRAETVEGLVTPEGRLLLCSQPLVKSLGERAIAEILIDTPLDKAAARLVQEALIADVRDNVTAVVIGHEALHDAAGRQDAGGDGRS